ncbi:MAG: phytanoyl-CoA dioxygenase family protein [Proteobacteria bacterium]|nr:phytanoyl-CoA dioxygenase family protein [Pseudomonadota bacterium]
MEYNPIRQITEEEIRTYEEDGIVCLRQFFDGETVEMLRDVVERDMVDPSPMVVDATRDGAGRFFGDTFVWKHFDELNDFVFNSPAADMASALFRSPKINLIFDQFLVKEPGTSTPTLWHHDQTYWPVAGHQVCTLWLALDPVTNASGAVEYVCGSHLWGQRFKAVSFEDEDRYKEDLPPVPDIDALRDQYKIVQFELEPGDCTLHHGLTVHGAPGNSTKQLKRRAYITRWAGEDVTYNPRPNLQPMLHDPEIAVGGPLDCSLFPVVRSQPA